MRYKIRYKVGMATRLPASTRQVLEPLLQSIPLTELRPLLKDATLRQYSNAYLPDRVAHLQTYDRLPPVEALTLAVQQGDLDIADEIIEKQPARQLGGFVSQLEYDAIKQRNSLLLNYVLDEFGTTSSYVPVKLVLTHDLQFLMNSLPGHALFNAVLVYAAEHGDIAIVRYAIKSGAIARDVALLVAKEALIHPPVDTSASDLRAVIQYLETLPSTASLETQLLQVAREIYPRIEIEVLEVRIASDLSSGRRITALLSDVGSHRPAAGYRLGELDSLVI